MGLCHQTTLVTVTYPVINCILRTLTYTLRLSDILTVINCTNSQASLVLSSCFDGVPAFIPTLNQRLTSLHPSPDHRHRHQKINNKMTNT